MQSAAVSKRRASGAFVLSALALIPLTVIAMVVGMVADIGWIWPAFVAAQLAFPRAIVRYTPFTHIDVPLVLTIGVWSACAWLFGFLSHRMRIRRLWIAAPLAVGSCIVIANVVIHLAGFHVTLDGP
jgi:hypothetical protein